MTKAQTGIHSAGAGSADRTLLLEEVRVPGWSPAKVDRAHLETLLRVTGHAADLRACWLGEGDKSLAKLEEIYESKDTRLAT